MTPEGKVVAYVRKLAKEYRWDVRKTAWVGRMGAPDLLILKDGGHFFVEVKAPGMRPRAEQIREHVRLRNAGFRVYVVDSQESAKDVFKWENDLMG